MGPVLEMFTLGFGVAAITNILMMGRGLEVVVGWKDLNLEAAVLLNYQLEGRVLWKLAVTYEALSGYLSVVKKLVLEIPF